MVLFNSLVSTSLACSRFVDVKLVARFSSMYLHSWTSLILLTSPATRVLNMWTDVISSHYMFQEDQRTLVYTDGHCRRTRTASGEWNLESLRIRLPISSGKVSSVTACAHAQCITKHWECWSPASQKPECYDARCGCVVGCNVRINLLVLCYILHAVCCKRLGSVVSRFVYLYSLAS